jgi:glutamyl-tRNA synthetase
LFKDRCDTTVALADWVAVFYSDVNVDPEVLQPMLNPEVHQAITALAQALVSCEWTPTVVAAQIKQVLTQAGIKMPHLAMPVRVLLCGQAQTPSLDAVISLFTRERVLHRLQKAHNFGL